MVMGRRASGVLALVGALSLTLALAITPSGQSRAAPTVSPTTLRPHAIKLILNGKRWPLESLTGSDTYLGIRAGKLRVEARWQTNARGTGYYVQIANGVPLGRELVRCSKGTSCVVPNGVLILPNHELTLTVKVLRTRGNKVVAAYKACLDGHA
jgi:hypothetical protein